MKKYVFFPAVSGIVLLLSICFVAPTQAAEPLSTLNLPKTNSTPQQVLKAFYKWYLYAMDEEIDVFTTKRKTLKKYLTSGLIHRIDKDQVEYSGDYFTQSNVFSEGWVEKIMISGLKVKETRATAFVTLAGDDTRVFVRLVKQSGHWKIDNVKNAARKP